MGLATSLDDPKMPGSVPKIAMLGPSQDCVVGNNVQQSKQEVDILARALSVGQPHKAIPLTVALALAAACRTKGSVAEEVCRRENERKGEGITIGHAGGKIVVSAQYDEKGELESSTVYRTARRLMEGKVFWK